MLKKQTRSVRLQVQNEKEKKIGRQKKQVLRGSKRKGEVVMMISAGSGSRCRSLVVVVVGAGGEAVVGW